MCNAEIDLIHLHCRQAQAAMVVYTLTAGLTSAGMSPDHILDGAQHDGSVSNSFLVLLAELTATHQVAVLVQASSQRSAFLE